MLLPSLCAGKDGHLTPTCDEPISGAMRTLQAQIVFFLVTCGTSLGIGLGLVCGAAATAHAAPVRGFLVVQPDLVRIRLLSPDSHETPKTESIPVAADLGTLSALLKLHSGDFIIAIGEMIDQDGQPGTEAVLIQGIESVGLQNLIGSWRTRRGDVLHFEDFSRASLYSMNHPRSASTLTPFKKLRYTLAPESGNGYSIFLVESGMETRRSVYVGRIELSSTISTPTTRRAFKLDILDPSSGQIAETFNFKRLQSLR